jgi:hypothetical protein
MANGEIDSLQPEIVASSVSTVASLVIDTGILDPATVTRLAL